MKALLWTEIEKMTWTDADQPAAGFGEVVIRTEVVGICGSELEGYLGHNSLRKPPMIMGHEFCGRISSLGERVSGLSVGTKVTVNPLLSCGVCDRCARGRNQLCDRRQIIGIHRPGAFGQYVAVPASAVVPVKEDTPSARAALAEPLACSLRAVRRAFEQGHTFPNVLVFGAGGIGLLCAKVARLLGADLIGIVDTNPARLDIALRVGAADFALDPGTGDIVDAAKRACGPKGVDVVIDAAGFPPTRSAAVRALNAGGTLMNIGLGVNETHLPVNDLIRSEIDVLGSFCYIPKDFRDAVQLLTNGQVNENGWTMVRPIEDGDAAFRELTSGRVAEGKILLTVPGE
ncbi:zinc-dependent alcohol dehydrogenase [Paenibacillus sp.]|uniref:zinc-dependent alcohol dehydrogenase n=1 Tax=Paenibacillus sp. TaxID=58172 RepID=UPI002D5760C1|nr:alcohol dehydrogenase catalytic domain-containing protein [Paenibacillus sp.]HZG56177.1 alcohol dehydrogenase catalytic domain-containing protein [Paenibacillus sp.]